MNYFPTTIVDNFLPDPDAVRNFALSDKIEWHTAWFKVTNVI